MPLFEYTGVDTRGATVQGSVEAESAWALIPELRARGVMVYAVAPEGGARGLANRPRSIELEDLNLFAEQLCSLSRAGMPLATALRELAHEVRGRRFRNLIDTAAREVAGGRSLGEVFERHGESFPPLYLALIRVGEHTGNLPGVLQRMIAIGHRRQWLRQRLMVAVAYPAFLLGALAVFFGLFVTEVIGQFEHMYLQFGAELPALTEAALSFGKLMRGAGLPAIALFAGLTALLYWIRGYVLPGDAGRLAAEAALLRAPVVGRLYQAILTARFARALGMLLENGAPILESLQLAGIATASTRFARGMARAATRVAQGDPVAQTVAATGLLRPIDAWILKHGESAGDLPGALARLAESCDRESERGQQSALGGLGAGLVIVCGILVGLAVIACFLPVFQFPLMLRG
ncbi:MAG: type II secretion system F family protein [Candidatus Hydrogenedentes bacterium]|nr:type II secretion system F family protein [Candidatus Hydrogenedentota bacterium]